MNICYLYLHRLAGRGSGRYMQTLLKYFKARKHTIHLVEAMRSKNSVLQGVNLKYVHVPYQIPVYQGRSDINSKVKLSQISDTKFFDLIRRFAECGIKMSEKNKLDIIHANHVSILPFSAYLTRKMTGTPYVVTAHGNGILSSLESKRNFEVARVGLEESKKVIANSKFTKGILMKEFGLSGGKMKVVYPGVDTEKFRPQSDRIKAATKRRYGCEGKKIVYSSGTFVREKGFRYLLDAAKMYEKEDPDIVTLITGHGPYQKEMERIIKKNGLKNTKIVGWILTKELIKLYSTADIFVTPTVQEEHSSMVSVESLALGTPVIATKVGIIPEIVSSDVGQLVEPGSPRAIAEAVLNRINDDSWIEKKGKKGRNLVMSRFSLKSCGRATEKVYKSALSK
ncbi:MAG: glycosyltransferase family 4 protein [Candidatus Aenigmarchaeota archaeon]|nr:glycosyltransferase family 4 protein [Candidatus Aenigmarchaeota archaeon]